MKSDYKSMLLSKERIASAVRDLGAQITRDYAGEELLVVCVLKGAFVFCADLVRQIDLPVKLDFLAASSYGSDVKSSGNVRITRDLETDMKGENVLLVEDIIDSGHTLKHLCEIFQVRGPKSLKICTLLDKKDRRVADIQPDYVCFEIPDEFVVGYGLDYASKYRNLPDIMVLDESVYAK